MKPIAALVFAETVRLCGSIEQQTQTERQLGGIYQTDRGVSGRVALF